MRGRFLVLEGMDGSGKTTQARRLVAWLEQLGRRPLHLREPGGTDLGEELRRLLLEPGREHWDPRTEALLFFAARSELLRRVVAPALDEGRDVVCERFTPSTLAYQGRDDALGSFVLALDELVVPPELQPDRVLILDLDAAEALRRAAAGGVEDAFEARGLEFQQSVRRGYQRYAARHGASTRLLAVDHLDAEEVEQRLRALVREVGEVGQHP